MIRNSSYKSRSSDNYPTDQWILDLFPNYFDPCPLNYDFDIENDQDGLAISWNYADYDGVFVNPPYSDPKAWVEKAIFEYKKARSQSYCPDDGFDGSALNIVMLLKHDSSTRAYKLLHEMGANFLMVQGRLKHGTKNSASFPSVLVVLN